MAEQKVIEPVRPEPSQGSASESAVPRSIAEASEFERHHLDVRESDTRAEVPESIRRPEAPKVAFPKLLNRIRSHRVVERIETEKDEKGVRSTLTVYASGPTSIRTQLQEDWKDGPNGPELVGWIAMAADYIIVKLSDPSSSTLSSKLAQRDAKLEATPIPGVYKVNFDGTDPVNLHEINEELKEVAEVEFSEPDFIMGIETSEFNSVQK